MEYAIDKNGNYIHHIDANNSTTYKCPDCLELVFIRRGLNACFFHKPIRDRTPLQRTCPEYHENNSYKKINNKLDILYINNGGIPLYLCNSGKRFELRAHFPTVSDKSLKKLKEVGAKILVNSESNIEIDRKVYSVENLDYYPVNIIKNWIDVKCEPCVSEDDIKRKWLWGIRGVDIEKDIYHSSKDGGYRVALKASISVGKSYRIMFYKSPPRIVGISFKNIGEIYLRKGITNKVIFIYEMNIEKFTEEAREFIEGKGYILAEKPNELLPLWPPGVFNGNEIFFCESKALFLHINHTKKDKLFFSTHNGIYEIYDKNENYGIVSLQVYGNKSVIISEENNDRFNSEIKYNINYNSSLVKKKLLVPKVIIKDSDDLEINFNQEGLKLPKDRKIYIKSNIPFCATVNHNNYVISSSNSCLEDVGYFLDLSINSKAFGTRIYSYKRKNFQNKLNKSLNWELEYLKLYRCTAPTVKADNRYFQLLYLLSQNINEKNIQLYRLIETWIKTNSIPVSAIRHMDKIFQLLGGVINE